MKTPLVTICFYVGLIVLGIGTSWWLAPYVSSWAAPASFGACLSLAFTALYIGELKQESVGQLYQALASANLRSAEHAAFSQQALMKVRTIRRLFMLSNVTKLLGAMSGLYLFNEKTATTWSVVEAFRFSLAMLYLSILLFVKLWAEVSSTESLLLAVKQDALLQGRRDDFQKAGRAAKAYDFDSDPAAQSFDKPPEAPALMPSGQ